MKWQRQTLPYNQGYKGKKRLCLQSNIFSTLTGNGGRTSKLDDFRNFEQIEVNTRVRRYARSVKDHPFHRNSGSIARSGEAGMTL